MPYEITFCRKPNSGIKKLFSELDNKQREFDAIIDGTEDLGKKILKKKIIDKKILKKKWLIKKNFEKKNFFFL